MIINPKYNNYTQKIPNEELLEFKAMQDSVRRLLVEGVDFIIVISSAPNVTLFVDEEISVMLSICGNKLDFK